jgi:hypothetical protein
MDQTTDSEMCREDTEDRHLQRFDIREFLLDNGQSLEETRGLGEEILDSVVLGFDFRKCLLYRK